MSGGATSLRLLLAVAVCAFGQAALAEAPRSAIPWLSESLTASPAPAQPQAPPAAGPLRPESIAVTPLGAADRDALGVLPSETTGFSPDLWGPTDAATARELILDAPATGVPEARALFLRLLLAEAVAPKGGDTTPTLLLARIDRLLEAGALEQADALILFADPAEPELFRRWFDIGLLTSDAEPACEALRRNPSLSPTLAARVFCLARGEDWNAAEITLTTGREIGSIPPDQQALLARFLDPELFESEPPPPIPDPLTPLDFLMREAVGLPRPPGPLPLAFLHHDLGRHTPMRIRIAAAERLVRSGAIGPAPLFAAYRAGEPAASGGVWDRAEAVQTLDAALAATDATGIAAALPKADRALAAEGLRVAMAKEYRDRLAGLDPWAFGDAARSRIMDLLLLAGETDAARRLAPDEPNERQAALLAIHDTRPATTPRSADAVTDAYASAVTHAFGTEPPVNQVERELRQALAEGRQGEAILRALALLADGAQVAPQSLTTALRILREAGQETAARQIATETLLAAGHAGQ